MSAALGMMSLLGVLLAAFSASVQGLRRTQDAWSQVVQELSQEARARSCGERWALAQNVDDAIALISGGGVRDRVDAPCDRNEFMVAERVFTSVHFERHPEYGRPFPNWRVLLRMEESR